MSSARLKDVAERAGTSVSAVSKAMKGSPEISEETKQRIFSAAQKLNYHPNSSARSLRLGKSHRIGVILPSFEGIYSDILAGIEGYTREKGYSVIVLNTQNEAGMERLVIDSMLSMPVDAILTVPVSLSNYKKINLPLICMSRYPYMDISGEISAIDDFDYVIVDDYEGQRLATEHLIKSLGANVYFAIGCEDINNVWGIKDRIRIAGFKKAFLDAGFDFDNGHIFWGATDIDSGYEVTSRICAAAKPPFGLCLTDDYVAIGAMHAIRDSGLRIPDDVSVIGYDNLRFCRHLCPALTTVYSQKRSAGEYAARHIVEYLENGERKPLRKIFQPVLKIRESTAPTR